MLYSNSEIVRKKKGRKWEGEGGPEGVIKIIILKYPPGRTKADVFWTTILMHEQYLSEMAFTLIRSFRSCLDFPSRFVDWSCRYRGLYRSTASVKLPTRRPAASAFADNSLWYWDCALPPPLPFSAVSTSTTSIIVLFVLWLWLCEWPWP